MPTIPDATLNQIKAAAPLTRVLEARGAELRQQGDDVVCHCPLPDHDDSTASFHITGDMAHCFVPPHLKPENPFAGKFLTEDVRHDPKTPPI